MLASLSIRDVVLIESLDLSFGDGFTALTGETGAGKSIVLDSLSLALGMRGDLSLIRQGTEQATVTAEFSFSSSDFPESLKALLVEKDILPQDNVLVLRRTIHQSSRGRAFINDQPVSISLLREVGDSLVEIHGQFDNLLNPGLHRQVLDEFTVKHCAEFESHLKDIFQAYQDLCRTKKELEEQRTLQADAVRQRSHYQQVLTDFGKLAPKENEEQDLLQKRQDIGQYGKIADAIQAALQNLNTPVDLSTALYTIQKNLERANTIQLAALGEICQSLDRARLEVADTLESLRKLYTLNQSTAEELNRIEERLYALRAVARKYALQPFELYEFYMKAQDSINRLEGDTELKQCEERHQECQIAYKSLAEKITQHRHQAASILEDRLGPELADLKLPEARFSINLTALEDPTSFGLDGIEFQIAANKGQKLAPLNKAASGGELARIMLALKVVLAESLTKKSDLSAIIFDEIDTGVGGSVAAAIGGRLAKLSGHVQVIAVTHSPQVAAHASHHFQVSKQEQDTHTMTIIRNLNAQERTEEIARMLAGAVVTDEARAAAIKLLDASGIR
ncbi:MAG: DNA repair protein RecN [Alphaproteobacteria bacterium]|nr:DNA repair protein RecN [Alphaproteobacteria bacterium]